MRSGHNYIKRAYYVNQCEAQGPVWPFDILLPVQAEQLLIWFKFIQQLPCTEVLVVIWHKVQIE